MNRPERLLRKLGMLMIVGILIIGFIIVRHSMFYRLELIGGYSLQQSWGRPPILTGPAGDAVLLQSVSEFYVKVPYIIGWLDADSPSGARFFVLDSRRQQVELFRDAETLRVRLEKIDVPSSWMQEATTFIGIRTGKAKRTWLRPGTFQFSPSPGER